MTQYNFGTIVPSTKSGVQLADDLNTWRDALHSSHKGPTAPAYKAAGMFWLDDTSAANHLLKYYDGADWIAVLSIDTTNNRASVVFAAERLSYPLAGGTANALTLTPAVALAAYFDLDVATFEAAANNTGAATLAVSGLGTKAIRKMVDGADIALTAGDLLDGNRYVLNYDAAANSAAGAWILVNPSTIPAIRGYMSGGGRANHLENDTLDATNDIVVRGGECASVSATPVLMKQAADLVKRLDATWSAGNNQGMLDQGTLGNNTYHIHRIMRPDTRATDIIASLSHDDADTVTMTIASPCVVTWGAANRGHGLVAGSTFQFSTTGALPTGVSAGTTYYVLSTSLTETTFRFSATNGGAAINASGSQSGVHTGQAMPLLPANYTEFRRLGSIVRAGGVIRPFRQSGDTFKLVTAISDFASSSARSSALLTLSVPQGVVVLPLITTTTQVAASSNAMNLIAGADEGSANLTISNTNSIATENTVETAYPPPSARTNTSGQMLFGVIINSGTIVSNTLKTYGWIDPRGRSAA